MILRHWLVAAAGAAVLLGCRAESPEANAAQAESSSGLQLVPLTVRTSSGVHRFKAEVAATEAEQARGLMFRDSLAPDAAMLFPFQTPRPASFWMKDTLIPLDMIFVRPDGSIAFIAVNTVPRSLEPVGVEEPLAAVVEIAGGRSAELGIEEGDKVGWPNGPQHGTSSAR